MIGNNRNTDLNQYALELRRSGKLFREIGAELGVSLEHARCRVVMGERFEKAFERGKNAKIMKDLLISGRLRSGIMNMDATEMTFDEFLDNVSQQKMLDTPNVGKSCVQELINAFRVKKISEEKIKEWLSVKIKKTKKKRRDAGIPKGPEEKYDTCQKYVIDKGRRVMGRLCNEPLTPKQKKFCDKHKP